MKPTIISETPMNLAQVQEIIKKVSEREKDLNFRTQKTAEYLDQMVKIDTKIAKKLFDALENLKIPRLRDAHFHKIVDLCPTTEDEVKLIVSGYNVTVTKENMKKIADTVKDVVPQE